MGALVASGTTNTRNVIRYADLQVSTSQLDIPITLFWGQRRISPNCIWYNDFQSHKQSEGKGGGKGADYTYSAAVILALGEGVMSAPVNVWGPSSTTTTTTLAALGLTFTAGTATQTPPAYVSANYPAQALAYMDTAYVFSPNMSLGSSATVPDYGFELQRFDGFTDTLTAPGWTNPVTGANTAGTDVSFADVIADFLTNPVYGMGFATADIADMTVFRAYQSAQGLYFSPCLTSQEKATEIIDRWATLANSWIYWSGTQVQFVTLGDSALSANGFSYAPDLAPAYALDLTDFIARRGDAPVEVDREDPADCYNRTVLEICDRTRGYVSSPVEYKDQQLVARYGLRDNSSTQADDICNPAVGAICAQLIGRRAAYIRNTYKFKLGYRYIRLLPGSIVTLTEPNIGLSGFPVRIRAIDEDRNGVLSVTAEELPSGIGTYYAINTPPPVTATTVDTNVDPGPVNPPAVCEPSSSFAQGQSVVLIAASGGANWGGANVFLSLDGVNYESVGTLTKPALQGQLTAVLPAYAGSGPDTADALAVNVAASLGVFPAVSDSNASNYTSLSWIAPPPAAAGGDEVLSAGGELLAFGAVSATSTYGANLTWLERGLYGTAAGAHAIGDLFTLFDVTGHTGSTLHYALPPQYVGRTLFLKFQSFNIFGNAPEALGTVATYSFTPTGASFGSGGAGVPAEPTGLTGIVQSSQVILSWNANPVGDNVTVYDLYRAAGTGTAFSSASLLWSGDALSFTDTNVDLVTGYTYFVMAANAIGASLPSAGFNAATLGINDGQVLQAGTFSAASEAAIDFTAQVKACGFIEITLWNVYPSNAGDTLQGRFRYLGADLAGVTYVLGGSGTASSGGSPSTITASAAAMQLSPAMKGTGVLTLRMFLGSASSYFTPVIQGKWSGYYTDGTTLENWDYSIALTAALTEVPTGISFFAPSPHQISFSYAIRGFQAA